jgi:hypothetical protein
MSTTTADNNSIDFIREAFFHPINLAVLLGGTFTAILLRDFGATSDVLLSTLFGAQLIYLGTVPKLPNFQRLIKMRKTKARTPEMIQRNLFSQLNPSAQKRFLGMKHYTHLVKQNFDKMPYTSQGLLDNINRQLQDLLTNYLNLLDADRRYSQYTNLYDEHVIKKTIETEQHEISQLSSERIKLAKKRRLVILKKRLERIKVAHERMLVGKSSMETIEEAIRYIYEQSMTMTNPEEIGFKLDNLLLEVEETSTFISELDADIMDTDLESIQNEESFGFSESFNPQASTKQKGQNESNSLS